MAKGDPRAGGSGTGYFPAIYQSAISQSAEDYDNIMKQYKNLGSSISSSSSSGSPYGEKVDYSPINPEFTELTTGPDFSQLRDIADTGGYSDADIGNLRARAISPIKSIYSSANRNLLRQKNLSGGYAPNFAAASAKMAREMSGQIGERTTAANAGIAELVQRGKLTGATSLAPLEAAEASRAQSVANMNAQIANEVARLNEANRLETARHNTGVDQALAARKDMDFNKILETIKGQQSTYGTTPAFASTIGGQTLSAANTVNSFPPVNKAAMSPVKPGGSVVGTTPNMSGFNPNLMWGLNQPRLGYGARG